MITTWNRSSRFAECEKRGWRRIAFCGMSELADDNGARTGRYLGKPLHHDFNEQSGVDAYLVTSLADAAGAVEQLAGSVPEERILVPSILGLNRH